MFPLIFIPLVYLAVVVQNVVCAAVGSARCNAELAGIGCVRMVDATAQPARHFDGGTGRLD